MERYLLSIIFSSVRIVKARDRKLDNFSLLFLKAFENKVRCCISAEPSLAALLMANLNRLREKLFCAEFLLKAALPQNCKFNLQQFINFIVSVFINIDVMSFCKILMYIWGQNMKFNILKYIGDVLSGGDGWPISLLVQRGSHHDFTNYPHKT